jgi:hypothetical protein
MHSQSLLSPGGCGAFSFSLLIPSPIPLPLSLYSLLILLFGVVVMFSLLLFCCLPLLV